MKTYIGTKVIQATPMSRAEYNMYRGWKLPEDENGLDEGYLVEYMDGGKPNHPKHAGYISWSPKEQFENAYHDASGLTFGLAIEAIKQGKMVARAGWNGEGMFLVLVNMSVGDVNFVDGLDQITNIRMLPHIAIKTALGPYVPWLASQTDMLSDDWRIVE